MLKPRVLLERMSVLQRPSDPKCWRWIDIIGILLYNSFANMPINTPKGLTAILTTLNLYQFIFDLFFRLLTIDICFPFTSVPRRAKQRMIELSQVRDGAKEEGMEGWAEACFTGNGFTEAKEEVGPGGGRGRGGCREGGGGKQLHCTSPPSSNSIMDSIPGEFALVINGHSLV